MKKNKFLSRYFPINQLRWLAVCILSFLGNGVFACPAGYYVCTVEGVTTCCPTPEVNLSIANDNIFPWVASSFLAFMVIGVLYARQLSRRE